MGLRVAIEPVSGRASSRPAFRWTAPQGVSGYTLRVEDVTRGVQIMEYTLTPVEAQCSGNDAYCTFTAPAVLPIVNPPGQVLPNLHRWILIAYNAGGNSPSSTATFTPFTSLDFFARDSNLRAVIFWAAFVETTEDVDDSGSSADNDRGLSRFSTFLIGPPYCSPNANPPSDNGAETPFPNWYIRHCPRDHRFMFARTMMNTYLNYERREQSLVGVLSNYSSSLNDVTYSLWQEPTCFLPDDTDPTINLDYNQARSRGLYDVWLSNYMTCRAALNNNPLNQRINRAYNLTIFPEINTAVNDFLDVTSDDLTDGAFGNLDLNFAGRSQITCVGRCYVTLAGQNTPTLVDHYQGGDTFVSFATPLTSMTPQLVLNAYSLHIMRISTYVPSYASVAQPVLRFSYTLDRQTLLGYVWTTRIYQQSQNMTHFPR